MKKTFNELNEIDLVIGELYSKNPTLRDTKFGYAYKRFAENNYIPLYKEMIEAKNNARIDNALEDEKTKEILLDPASQRGFKYSKEGLKSVIKAEKQIQELFDVKEIEIKPFISSFIPEEITDEQKELLTGILI